MEHIKEKMQAGETYYAFDPELMKLHRDCLKWVEEYNRTYFRDYTQGGELLRAIFTESPSFFSDTGSFLV